MRIAFFLLPLALVAACTAPKADRKKEGEKVMQLSREWSKVAASGDVERTVAYWADDAYMVSGDHPELKGKDAIREMVADSYKIPGFQISWEPESVEVSEAGDMAYLIEKTTVSFSDSSGAVQKRFSKAVSIWRKGADGNWKNAVDISTPDVTRRSQLIMPL